LRQKILEHRAGIEPANTDFADQRVSHFAIGASCTPRPMLIERGGEIVVGTRQS
jgi:hypothetical protein